MTDSDEDVFDRRLDWALGEKEGREAPPDVTDAVMARLDEEPVRRRSRTAWLAAAIVLLGLGAVVGVFWSKHNDDVREAAQDFGQDPVRQRLQDMPYVVVKTRAELDALPQDVQGLELVGMGYQEVDALIKRCPYVRKLRLRGDSVEGGTIFRALWFQHLRHLDIDGCTNATPNVIEAMAKDTELLQVKFGGQDWLTFEHLELLAKCGIEPIVDPAHALVFSVAQLVCDYGEKMRERQLNDLLPIRFVIVRSIEDIAALSVDTEAIDGLDLEDQAVGALARLQNLKHLRLRSGVQAKIIPVLNLDATYSPRTSEGNRKSVTDAGLAQLVPLAQLETLELAGTIEVKGSGLAHLARLPKLRQLSLICIDTDGADFSHLPKFPALRRLRLDRNHGFGLRGMRHVSQCRNLTGLVITACPQIVGDGYKLLRNLDHLRELRIRQAGPGSWRNDTQRKLTPEEEVQREVLRSLGNPDWSHLDDSVIADIAEMTALETLELTFTAGTDAGFEKLAQLTDLRSAILAGNDGVTAEALRALPQDLRELDISSCKAVDDSVGALIRASFPKLEILRVSNNDWLTDLSDIARMKTLRQLDVAHCQGLGKAAAESLKQCDFLRRLDMSWSHGLRGDLRTYLQARGVAVSKQRW